MKNTSPLHITLLFFTLFATTRTEAIIVYSGPQNIIYNQFNNLDTLSLFDEPGTWDDIRLDIHVFEDPSFQNSYTFQNLLNVHGNFVEFAVGSFFFDIKNFSSGELIDGSRSWSGNSYKDFSNYRQEFDPFEFISENGEFRNASGYAGLRLTDGADVYYGWIQVAISNFNNSGITGTLIDWAYENTPGQEIHAGAIPEPLTSALLFGGSVGLFIALRRRNN